MKKTKYLCDHCGKEINTDYGFHYDSEIGELELCQSCMKEVEDENNKFLVYKRAYVGWLEKFTHKEDECDGISGDAPLLQEQPAFPRRPRGNNEGYGYHSSNYALGNDHEALNRNEIHTMTINNVVQGNNA